MVQQAVRSSIVRRLPPAKYTVSREAPDQGEMLFTQALACQGSAPEHRKSVNNVASMIKQNSFVFQQRPEEVFRCGLARWESEGLPVASMRGLRRWVSAIWTSSAVGGRGRRRRGSSRMRLGSGISALGLALARPPGGELGFDVGAFALSGMNGWARRRRRRSHSRTLVLSGRPRRL